MLLISDDIVYSNRIIGGEKTWTVLRNNSNLPINLLSNLYSNSELYCSNLATDFWDAILFKEFSKNSQFDQINEFNRSEALDKNLVLFAGSGTKFHGFHNRSWESLSGNLHLTINLNLELEAYAAVQKIIAISAVSILDTFDSLSYLKNKASVKWMNDILLNEAKVAGIISQGQIKGNKLTNIVLGIGINVNTTPTVERDEVIPNVTSLKSNSNFDKDINLFEVTLTLMENLRVNFKKTLSGRFKEILNKYIARSFIIGKEIKVLSDVQGREDEIINEGLVESISENLEIVLKGNPKPISDGRIILIN